MRKSGGVMADNQLGLYGPSSSEVMVDMIASLVGVFFQRAVMAPSYRITVLATVEGELVRSGRLPPTGFGGIIACVRHVYAREGLSSFFRGFLADAVLAVFSALMEEVSSVLVSGSLESMLHADTLQSMSAWTYITISLVSTSTAVLLATPMTGFHNTVVTNYMGDIVAPETVANEEGGEAQKDAQKSAQDDESNERRGYKFKSAREVATSIRKRWGWRGFYFGVGLDAMAVFLYRGTYYYALQMLPTAFHDRHPYAVARCLAIVAGCITQPLEVISRRMQLTASSGATKYKNMVDCVRTIVAEEGYSALWAGLRARMLVTCAGMAIVELRRLF